jgi:hypothetical protein
LTSNPELQFSSSQRSRRRMQSIADPDQKIHLDESFDRLLNCCNPLWSVDNRSHVLDQPYLSESVRMPFDRPREDDRFDIPLISYRCEIAIPLMAHGGQRSAPWVLSPVDCVTSTRELALPVNCRCRRRKRTSTIGYGVQGECAQCSGRVEGPIPNPSQLGEAIREERQEKTDLTIEEFALEAGMEYSYLSDIERKGRNLSWRKLASIAEVLEVDVSQLIARAEEIARTPRAKPDDDRPNS